MTTTSVATVSTVSATPAVSGKAQKGEHHNAFVAQIKGAFPVTAKLELLQAGVNPWRNGTHGSNFYNAVLAKGVSTVGAAIELAATSLKLTPKQVQDHLAYLYTWQASGKVSPFLRIDGKVWSAGSPVAPKPVVAKPVKASAKK